MIGKCEFIKSAGSLSTAEHPLIASDADMDAYVVATYENVVFFEDLRQSLTMPAFEGWSDCNMVRFTDNAGKVSYYWIVGAVRSSDVQGANVYDLAYNAVTSLLKSGDTLRGQWLRSPVNYTPWKQQNIISGTMAYGRETAICDTIPRGFLKTPVLWVSVTATKDPAGTQGTYEIYGFPVRGASLADIYSDDTSALRADLGAYPSLHDIFGGQSLSKMGLTTDEIMDISVTPFMPFETANITTDSFVLTDASGYVISPSKVTYNNGTETAESECYMYNITSGIADDVQLHHTSGTIPLTDIEYACGSLNIVKGDGTILANIPTAWAVDGAIVFDTQVVCDYAQMCIVMRITDADGNDKTVLTIPCDHIPYIGNSWDTYRAYSMSYDRDAMQFGISQARDNATLSLIKSGANAVAAVATGNISGAVGSAVNAVDTIQNQYLYEKAANFNQQLTERRTQAQPGNAYNVGYGIFQLYMNMIRPVRAIVSIPDGLTQDIYDSFVSNFGYANEGEYDQTLKHGFYQGTVYSSPTLTGPRFNELINAFNAGIRLIDPAGQ